MSELAFFLLFLTIVFPTPFSFSLLLSQMRYTKKVSVWPVGLVGAMKFERPVVENGKVVRFHTGWRPNRPFPIDMAGFAVSLNLVLANSEACFDGNAEMGFLESSFLQNLVTMEELEPKADMCTKVHIRCMVPAVSVDCVLGTVTCVMRVVMFYMTCICFEVGTWDDVYNNGINNNGLCLFRCLRCWCGTHVLKSQR